MHKLLQVTAMVNLLYIHSGGGIIYFMRNKNDGGCWEDEEGDDDPWDTLEIITDELDSAKFNVLDSEDAGSSTEWFSLAIFMK